MSNEVSVLVVPASGEPDARTINPDLSTLQALVDGPIENVSPTRADYGLWHAYCNEEGKLRNLPFNRRATDIAHFLGWPIGDVLCGTVVFLGEGEDGEEFDFPVEAAAALSAMDQHL